MDISETISRLRAERALLQEFSVRAIYVFGSVVHGQERPDSDIDLLVEFDPQAQIGLFAFARLQRRLSQILEHPVDLVTPDALHAALKDRILEEAVRAA